MKRWYTQSKTHWRVYGNVSLKNIMFGSGKKVTTENLRTNNDWIILTCFPHALLVYENLMVVNEKMIKPSQTFWSVHGKFGVFFMDLAWARLRSRYNVKDELTLPWKSAWGLRDCKGTKHFWFSLKSGPPFKGFNMSEKSRWDVLKRTKYRIVFSWGRFEVY